MGQQPTPIEQDDRLWAAIAHGLTFIEGGILGPLVVYLIKRDDSPFVAFHALQSLYFGLLALTIIVPVSIVTCGLGALLVIPYMILEILAVVAAYNGEWYELPIAGPLARRSHGPEQTR